MLTRSIKLKAGQRNSEGARVYEVDQFNLDVCETDRFPTVACEDSDSSLIDFNSVRVDVRWLARWMISFTSDAVAKGPKVHPRERRVGIGRKI